MAGNVQRTTWWLLNLCQRIGRRKELVESCRPGVSVAPPCRLTGQLLTTEAELENLRLD